MLDVRGVVGMDGSGVKEEEGRGGEEVWRPTALRRWRDEDKRTEVTAVRIGSDSSFSYLERRHLIGGQELLARRRGPFQIPLTQHEIAGGRRGLGQGVWKH